MRTVYLFFISLCFFLLRGHSYAYAGAHHRICYSPAQDIQKTQQIKLANKKQDCTISKTTSLTDDKEYLTDVEDEDDNIVFARKYVLLAKYSFILFYTFILSQLCNSSKIRLPFCSHLSHTSSCKYLVQRALRI